jgi:hypothetical protein
MRQTAIGKQTMLLTQLKQPRAITMWDFSWIERRWPGAGYECWDRALDELAVRGYDAVRIDACPHLTARDAAREWTVIPCWNQQDWGSPARVRIQIQPALNTFLRKCRDRGILVGLSSWFQRVEEANVRAIPTAGCHARIWKETLDTIAADGLLDTILYLDFCNEWPLFCWAPFFKPGSDDKGHWCEPQSLEWIRDAITALKRDYPDIACTFSSVGPLGCRSGQHEAIRGTVDFLDPHIFMAIANDNEFYKRVGYNFERFDPKGYENVALHAEDLYRADPDYWLSLIDRQIDTAVADSELLGVPLVTTECWGIVDYKDWPMLGWEWVKETCAHGVRRAAATGRWRAIATSNFCGPQFHGMWRDVAWHLEMTERIKASKLPPPPAG